MSLLLLVAGASRPSEQDINQRLAQLEALDRTHEKTHEEGDGPDKRTASPGSGKRPLGFSMQPLWRNICEGDSTPGRGRGDASLVGGRAGSRDEHQGSGCVTSSMRGSGGDTDEANGEPDDSLWRQEDEDEGEGERGSHGVSPWEMLPPALWISTA